MKVYVVVENDPDYGPEVLGVYSSREAAEQACVIDLPDAELLIFERELQ